MYTPYICLLYIYFDLSPINDAAAWIFKFEPSFGQVVLLLGCIWFCLSTLVSGGHKCSVVLLLVVGTMMSLEHL